MLPIWDTIKACCNCYQNCNFVSILVGNKCCRFVQKRSIPNVDHKCCKKSRQKITFFHDIFMRKFSTCCLLLLSDIVKIDLIPSSHFLAYVVKIDFLLYFVAFLFTCQNPSENFGDHFSLSFHYEKVVIDHFQKVLVIFGNLEFYLIFTFCHFLKFSLFQKISLSPNESRFGLMKFSSLIGCVTKIDINCA